MDKLDCVLGPIKSDLNGSESTPEIVGFVMAAKNLTELEFEQILTKIVLKLTPEIGELSSKLLLQTDFGEASVVRSDKPDDSPILRTNGSSIEIIWKFNLKPKQLAELVIDLSKILNSISLEHPGIAHGTGSVKAFCKASLQILNPKLSEKELILDSYQLSSGASFKLPSKVIKSLATVKTWENQAKLRLALTPSSSEANKNYQLRLSPNYYWIPSYLEELIQIELIDSQLGFWKLTPIDQLSGASNSASPSPSPILVEFKTMDRFGYQNQAEYQLFVSGQTDSIESGQLKWVTNSGSL